MNTRWRFDYADKIYHRGSLVQTTRNQIRQKFTKVHIRMLESHLCREDIKSPYATDAFGAIVSAKLRNSQLDNTLYSGFEYTFSKTLCLLRYFQYHLV